MGATLWTDFAGQNPIAMQLAQFMMNDYHTIRYGAKYRKLTPNDILREYNETLHWMEETLNQLDGPVFMITHHQPLECMGDPMYQGHHANAYYYSDLSNLILDNENLVGWICERTN